VSPLPAPIPLFTSWRRPSTPYFIRIFSRDLAWACHPPTNCSFAFQSDAERADPFIANFCSPFPFLRRSSFLYILECKRRSFKLLSKSGLPPLQYNPSFFCFTGLLWVCFSCAFSTDISYCEPIVTPTYSSSPSFRNHLSNLVRKPNS